MKRFMYTFVFFLSIVFLIGCGGDSTEVVILHWNDFHSQNNPISYKDETGNTRYVGGYAYLSGYVDSLRSIYSNCLVLHAGDELQGTPISSLTRGMSQVLLLNLIQPDAFPLGNHEFDYGLEAITRWIQRAKFPIVSANLWSSSEGKSFVKPYILYRFQGIDIGIIGLAPPDLKRLTVPSATKGIKVLDVEKVVNQYVSVLKDTAELIVLLSHMGFEQDSLLATRIQGVNYIFGGHSHTVLRQPVKVNGIEIFQAGSKGRFLGFLKIKIDRQGVIRQESYKLIPVEDEKIRPNKQVQALIDSLNGVEGESMDEVIGELRLAWKRSRGGESNLGDWLCDVIRESLKVDIAIQNNGGIRKDLEPGPIRVRDIWEIAPFGNHLVRFYLTGEQIKKFLEYQISRRGLSIQVSGLRFTYDSRKKELISVTVGNQPLEADRTYSLATNNYVFGQFYKYFGQSPEGIRSEDLDIIDRDLYVAAVKKQKVISQSTDGRIFDVAAP